MSQLNRSEPDLSICSPLFFQFFKFLFVMDLWGTPMRKQLWSISLPPSEFFRGYLKRKFSQLDLIIEFWIAKYSSASLFPETKKKKSTFQSFESNCPGKHHHFSAQKLVLHLGNISSVLNHWYPQKQSFFQSIFTLTQKSKSTQLTPELSRHVNQSNRT